MTCKNCGGRMLGDGYTTRVLCERLDPSAFTDPPDADPVECDDSTPE